MTTPKNFPWSFTGVEAFSEDRIYFVATHDESTNNNIPVSALMRRGDDWGTLPIGIFAVGLCALAYPERTVLALGHEGTVIRWGTQGSAEEHVDATGDGPTHGNMREIRTIGQHAYAVGMGRIVYRCDGASSWTRINAGVRVDSEQNAESGFNSIHGFSEDDCYAVGWGGEIWRYTQQRWRQCSSPTQMALHRVVCAGDGYVYALGERGLIIKGRGDSWSAVQQDLTLEAFWDACWFKDRLYAATSKGLFVLSDDALAAVPTGSRGKSRSDCFSRLSATDDCIWSVGEKMVLYSRDGQLWQEVDYP